MLTPLRMKILCRNFCLFHFVLVLWVTLAHRIHSYNIGIQSSRHPGFGLHVQTLGGYGKRSYAIDKYSGGISQEIKNKGEKKFYSFSDGDIAHSQEKSGVKSGRELADRIIWRPGVLNDGFVKRNLEVILNPLMLPYYWYYLSHYSGKRFIVLTQSDAPQI